MAAELEDDEDDAPRKPRVTHLQGPSRITIGPQQVSGAKRTASASDYPAPLTKPSKAAVRTGIDYSKWDSMNFDDTEADEGEYDEDMDDGSAEYEKCENSAASTTSLGKHSAVLGKLEGVRSEKPPTMKTRVCTDAESMEAKAEFQADAEERDMLTPEELASLHKAFADKNMVIHPPPDYGSESSSETPEAAYAKLVSKLTRNGSDCGSHLWKQTEKDVEISVRLPAGTRAKDLTVQVTPASTEGRQRLLVTRTSQPTGESQRQKATLFDKAMAYPVEQPDDAVDLSWEVTDLEPRGGCRALRVALTKEVVHGVVVWWARAFDGDPELNTLEFPDRKHASRVQANKDVWDQAQQMFRDSVAARPPPTQIHLDPSEEHGVDGG
uniref:CS domain-containing protein n=1 Tax=Chrysotila carterae TaxID=13221 RepID=A0A7S4B6S4_CHRCT